VGALLRRLSLDELPQVFNVFKGEMSLVGPRPPIPYEVECYETWHRKRLDVKPGLTGLSQVSGRYRLSFQQMVQLDIYYVENWSPWLDLKIILKTIPALFMKEWE
jgi:lipopolysaccharide/colanic/teichoic acid biosynthesis glycosyltransferase